MFPCGRVDVRILEIEFVDTEGWCIGERRVKVDGRIWWCPLLSRFFERYGCGCVERESVNRSVGRK